MKNIPVAPFRIPQTYSHNHEVPIYFHIPQTQSWFWGPCLLPHSPNIQSWLWGPYLLPHFPDKDMIMRSLYISTFPKHTLYSHDYEVPVSSIFPKLTVMFMRSLSTSTFPETYSYVNEVPIYFHILQNILSWLWGLYLLPHFPDIIMIMRSLSTSTFPKHTLYSHDYEVPVSSIFPKLTVMFMRSLSTSTFPKTYSYVNEVPIYFHILQNILSWLWGLYLLPHFPDIVMIMRSLSTSTFPKHTLYSHDYEVLVSSIFPKHIVMFMRYLSTSTFPSHSHDYEVPISFHIPQTYSHV